jgi:hypothetical protein
MPKAERADLQALSSYAELHPRDSRLVMDEIRQDSGYQLGSQRKQRSTYFPTDDYNYN